jgi:hypothetical protein
MDFFGGDGGFEVADACLLHCTACNPLTPHPLHRVQCTPCIPYTPPAPPAPCTPQPEEPMAATGPNYAAFQSEELQVRIYSIT